MAIIITDGTSKLLSSNEFVEFFHYGSNSGGKTVFSTATGFTLYVHSRSMVRTLKYKSESLYCVALDYIPQYPCLFIVALLYSHYSNSLVLPPPLLDDVIWKCSTRVFLGHMSGWKHLQDEHMYNLVWGRYVIGRVEMHAWFYNKNEIEKLIESLLEWIICSLLHL